MEAALLAAIDRNIDMQLELLERIERLEQVHANMRRLVEALDAQERSLQPVRANPPIVETSAPPLTEKHESAPVAVLTPPASDDSTLSRMLSDNLTRTGAIVASLFLLALLILQRYKKQRRSRLDDDAAPDTELPTATEQPGKQARSRTAQTAGIHSQPEATRNRTIDATQSILDFEVSRAPDQFFEPVKRKTRDKQGSARQDKARQAGSTSHAATTLTPNVDPATIINHNENDEDLSAVELADVMISFGRVDGAAEALEAFVENNPKKAVKPWLKLTEVYYKAGKRDEFDTVAANLHRTFNVQTLKWAQYAQSAPLPGLEAMPHIVERLTAIWASPECQFYIDSLIRDNRQGTRGGFDLETLDDLLMRTDILDVQLGRYRSNPE